MPGQLAAAAVALALVVVGLAAGVGALPVDPAGGGVQLPAPATAAVTTGFDDVQVGFRQGPLHLTERRGQTGLVYGHCTVGRFLFKRSLLNALCHLFSCSICDSVDKNTFVFKFRYILWVSKKMSSSKTDPPIKSEVFLIIGLQRKN